MTSDKFTLLFTRTLQLVALALIVTVLVSIVFI